MRGMSLVFVLVLMFTGLEVSSAEKFVPMYKKTYGSVETRIINGTEAAKNQFPHQAAVYVNIFAFCGGSLISKNWVLTAAHCVDNAVMWSVYLGSHDLSQTEPGRVILKTRNAVRHENYDRKTLANDVGLIGLPEEVSLNEQINIIPLPPRSFVSRNFVGTVARVSGWGKTADSDTSITKKLQFVDLTVMGTPECRAVYENEVSDTIYCCSGDQRKTPCNGDSGGALTVGSGKDFAHLGIVSFVSGKGCASGLPSGFTATPLFLDWISNKTGIPIQD